MGNLLPMLYLDFLSASILMPWFPDTHHLIA